MTSTSHLRELDGIRGIAILLVLMVHFGDFGPTKPILLESVARAAMGVGWIGVDLFFVLSGCLITRILLDAKGSATYFRSFYIRRALRILPLYYLSVGVYFLANSAASAEQFWYWSYLANWRIAFAPYSAIGLGHFWTLAIEEQFYLVWPLIVFAASEPSLIRLCWIVIASCLALRALPASQALQGRYPDVLYLLTPFRVDSLAFGALALLLYRNAGARAWVARNLRGVAGAALLSFVAAVAIGRSARSYSTPMGIFGFSSIGLLCACLVFHALADQGASTPGARLLRNGVLRRFGRYSYAIYVIHWPVSLYVTGLCQSHIRVGGGLTAALVSVAAGTAISYALGVLSWNVLEKHFLRWKARFPYARL